MSEFRLPLSGDVTQAINPWKWVFAPGESQIGLFNVNLGSSSDPELEQEILNRVGTYGKQLGQIGDVLRVLLDHVKLDHLHEDEKQQIKALRLQLDLIDHIKERNETDEIGVRKTARAA